MAKFVIAGESHCPYFARAELVADTLSRNLPDFKVCKILKDTDEWKEWLKHTCSKNNWKHTRSPIIWRELVDRGGKGMLIGDVNDFLEYTKGYYGISTELTSEDLRKISAENANTYGIIKREQQQEEENIKPLIITITNPESIVLDFLLPEILNGNTFGKSNEIAIRLYSPENSEQLLGLKMEIEDLASPNLRYLKIHEQAAGAFTDADYIILFDELQPENEESATFKNPYVTLAKQIDEYAKRTCKILISPLESRSETYGLVNVFSRHLNRIDARTNLIGNSMCEEMIAKSILAQRLNVNPAYIKDVIQVGQSFKNTYYIDISKAKVTNYDGAVWARKGTHWLSLVNMIADKDWIHKDFLALLHERGNLISEKLQREGVYTFAQSVLKLLRLWSADKNDDCLYSVIANVNGHYSIDADTYISLPVKFEAGTFQISDNYFETNALVTEISQDAVKRVGERYKDEMFLKDGDKAAKSSIPQVKIN